MNDAATPATATAAKGLDLPGAARAIEKILVGDDRRERRQSAADGDAPGESAADDRAPGDEGDGSTEAPVPSDEGDEQPRYTVKIDGEDVEVPLAELLKGYQRQVDYTKKTMRLGEERRELKRTRERADADLAAAQTERQHHAQQLDSLVPHLRQQLQAHFGNVDWARLAQENPAQFAAARPVFEGLVQQLQQAEAAQIQIRQMQATRDRQLQEARRDYIAQQRRALAEKLPELGDPERAPREMAALRSYLTVTGYHPEELNRLVDHRDFILARKAMLYDRLMDSKGKVADTVAALPKVQRPGTAPGRSERGAERRSAMMKRLKRTGRTEDAARLIEDML